MSIVLSYSWVFFQIRYKWNDTIQILCGVLSDVKTIQRATESTGIKTRQTGALDDVIINIQKSLSALTGSSGVCSENNIPLTDGQDGLKMANKKIDNILFELFSYKKSQFCHFWFPPENIYTTLPLICCIIFDSPFLFFFYRALTVYKRLPCHFIIIFRAICTFIFFFIVVCFFLYCYSFLWLNLFEIIKLLQRHGIYLFYIEKLRYCHYLRGFFNSKFKLKCILKVLFIIILI